MIIRTLNQFPIPVILLTSIFIALCSCNKCKDTPTISYFAFEEMSPLKKGIIDQSSHTITVEVPESTDVTNLTPTISVGSSDCLNMSPMSGISQDFSTWVVYEVSNEMDEMVQYEVKVQVEEPEPTDSTLSISWSTGSDIPVAVAWSGSVMLENKFYVIGGGASEDIATNLVQVYNPETDSWNSDIAGLQQKRWGHSATVVNGKIYVMGGNDAARGDALTSIEVYDPVTGSWKYEGEMNMGRIGHRAVEYQGKIYVFGGETQEPSPGTLDNVEVYDPATLTWETLTSMPTPRQLPAICIVGDVVYVLGGGISYPYPGSTTIEAYNITDDHWEEKAELKIGIADINACEIDGKIICVGGIVLWATGAVSNVQVYDPVSNQVYMANEKHDPIASYAVFAYQGKIYTGGGYITAQPEFTFSSKLSIGVPEF